MAARDEVGFANGAAPLVAAPVLLVREGFMRVGFGAGIFSMSLAIAPVPAALAQTLPGAIGADDPQLEAKPKIIPRPLDFPVKALREHHEGDTRLTYCVTEKGEAKAVVITSSSGFAELDKATLNFVKNSKFTPGMSAGKPVRVCGVTLIQQWRVGLPISTP